MAKKLSVLKSWEHVEWFQLPEVLDFWSAKSTEVKKKKAKKRRKK
jgi:hypothetical protein